MRKLQKSLAQAEQIVSIDDFTLLDFDSLEAHEKDEVFQLITQIVSNADSEKYYYGKVFSSCVQFIKTKILENQVKSLDGDLSKVRGKFERLLSAKDIAEMAGLEYFQLRDLSFGKNTSSTLLKFMTFIKKHGFSIEDFLLHPTIVKSSYQYFLTITGKTTTQ